MGVKINKELLTKMTIQERFDYLNKIKQMKFLNKDPKPKTEPWVDEERSDYDNFSDGKDELDNGWYDDSNEY